MATKRRAMRTKAVPSAKFVAGKEGRRTGVRAKAVSKDADNLDNIDEFFASDSDGDDFDLEELEREEELGVQFSPSEPVAFGEGEEEGDEEEDAGVDMDLPEMPDLNSPSPPRPSSGRPSTPGLSTIGSPGDYDYGTPTSFTTVTPRASFSARGTPASSGRRRGSALAHTPLSGRGAKAAKVGAKRARVDEEEFAPVDTPGEERYEYEESPMSVASLSPQSVLESPTPQQAKKRQRVQSQRVFSDITEGENRPRRTRRKPLSYWKNEQVVYAPDKEAGFSTVVGVVEVEKTPVPVRRAPYKKRAHIPTIRLADESGREADYTLAKTTANIPLHPLELTESEDTMFCYLTRGTKPARGKRTNKKIKTGIAYRTEELVNGVLKIGVRCKTPMQVSHGALENFFVIHGFLEAIINGEKHLLPSGSFITVPAGIPFSLVNRGRSTCRLHFNTLRL